MMPIIFKNLESHSLKNLKANLMYCITITFLVYSGSNFMSQSKYLSQMCDIIFGSDLALKGVSTGVTTLLDERKLADAL